jgi:hypothetical protein
MCRAMSLIATRTKVYWELGMDGHEDIKKKFKLKDDKKEGLVLIEIVPENGNYFKPDKWILKFDNVSEIPPDWWKVSHEKMCWEAHKKWLKILNKILVRKEIINPFKLPEVKKISKKHIKLLKEWDSVCDSVWDSVWDSVRDSVRAYVGSFFNLPRKSWKYTEKIKTKGYPFQCLVDLWEKGLVPSFDGKTWRLHTGKDAKIVYEIGATKLRGENWLNR